MKSPLEDFGPAPSCGHDPVHTPSPQAVSVLFGVVDQPLHHTPGILNESFCLAIQVGGDVEPVDFCLEFPKPVFAKLPIQLQLIQVFSRLENVLERVAYVGEFDGGTDGKCSVHASSAHSGHPLDGPRSGSVGQTYTIDAIVAGSIVHFLSKKGTQTTPVFTFATEKYRSRDKRGTREQTPKEDAKDQRCRDFGWRGWGSLAVPRHPH